MIRTKPAAIRAATAKGAALKTVKAAAQSHSPTAVRPVSTANSPSAAALAWPFASSGGGAPRPQAVVRPAPVAAQPSAQLAPALVWPFPTSSGGAPHPQTVASPAPVAAQPSAPVAPAIVWPFATSSGGQTPVPMPVANPLLGPPLQLPYTTTGWWKISIANERQSWKYDTAHRARALRTANALRNLGIETVVEEGRVPDPQWRKAANMANAVSKVHPHLLPSAEQLAAWREEARVAALQPPK